MSKKSVSVIILNLNNKEMTGECLDSIKENTSYENYNVVVVDNGSTDGSVDFIRSNFGFVDLIENKYNRGFSGGNNDVIKHAIKKYNSSYFYLLNNDTLVKKNWLTASVKTAEKSEKIGIVGSKQLNFENKPSISAGWIRWLDVKYHWKDEESDVNWVSGAGFLVKREVFDEIGFLDEVYNPAYYEETDFEKRALDAGFRIVHCPDSVFLHKGGATSSKELESFSDLFYRNRFIFFVRNHGFLYFLPRMILDVWRSFRKNGIWGVKRLFASYRKGYILINKR